jgi:hypothetical protein
VYSIAASMQGKHPRQGMNTGDTMAKNLSSAELDAEHVELLPARTLVTTLLVPVPTTGGVVSALGGGVENAAQTPCTDVPWWAPKPPGC